MCEFCGKCWRVLKRSVKGITVLLGLMVFHLLSFTAFLSLSIGFSSLVGKAYEYFMSPATFPNSIEAFICMYLMTVFSEFHIFCQQECIGAAMLTYNRLYHNLMNYGSMFIYISLYLFAFGQLYTQFEVVHVSNFDEAEMKKLRLESPTGSVPFEETGFSPNDTLHTALFLLALSFLVYCTSKLIHLDIINQLRRINTPSSCVHCVVTLAFFGLHLLINILYSIPLFIVAFSLKMYTKDGNMAYIQMNFVACLSGVVFAVIETRKPWPIFRCKGPFYFYENNTRAKSILGQVQIIWILICFYSPNSAGKIKRTEFNAGSDAVIYFCFAVGFNVIHFVKQLVFIGLSKQEHPDIVFGPGDQPNNNMINLLEEEMERGAIIIPNSELDLSRPRWVANISSNQAIAGNNIEDKKDEDTDCDTTGSNNNNNLVQTQGRRLSLGPEIAELLAVRNATESYSGIRLMDFRDSYVTKTDEEIMMAIDNIENALILRQPFEIDELPIIHRNVRCKSEETLMRNIHTNNAVSSVCTQTECNFPPGFLTLGVDENDSEIWTLTYSEAIHVNNVENKDKQVSLIIGSISEDDVQVIRTMTDVEVETVEFKESKHEDEIGSGTEAQSQLEDSGIRGGVKLSRLDGQGVDSNLNVDKFLDDRNGHDDGDDMLV